MGPTHFGSLQSPKLVRIATAPAHLVPSLAICPLQTQLPPCYCFCLCPGGSLVFAFCWFGILWNPGACLFLCMLRQCIAQSEIQIGCMLARQSQDTSHCQWLSCGIRSSAKILIQVCPQPCGVWDELPALGQVHVCLSCPGLALESRLFQSLKHCYAGAPGKALGNPSPASGV